MLATNLQGTENVLGEATELGAGRIVHVSSIVTHGPTGSSDLDETHQRTSPPETMYEKSKLAAHVIAQRWQNLGAPLIIASPAGVVGPGDHSTLGYYARLYIRGFGIPMMAKGCRATVHVDDCAEGIALAAEKGRLGEEYILSGGSLSNREMLKTWKKTKGGPRFAIWLARGTGDIGCLMVEPLQRLLRLPNIISKEVFINGSINWCYSGAKAERELGACFRDPAQAWLDTLEGEQRRRQEGKSWRYIGP
jgi:nucleoside-diphosphate-sugar epimerase